MTWRNRLLPASFRGIGFFVERDTAAGGRRIALHEYPLCDLPYAEDLGRRAREYSVEAVLIGADYDQRLPLLIAALERSGPGLLTHPAHGLLSVAVQRYRTTLAYGAEGGMARIAIECVEAGQRAYPLSYLDTLSGVASKAATLFEQAQAYVAMAYTIAGLPSLVYQAGLALLYQVLAPLEAVGALVGMTAGNRARQVAGLGAAVRAAPQTAGSPALIGAVLADQVGQLRTLAGAPWPAYQALRPLMVWGATLPEPPETTPARRAEANNQRVLVGAVRDLATAHACVAALSALARGTDATAVASRAAGVPVSSGEIIALRSTLLGAIDARQLLAPDALYDAWSALREAVSADLSARALVAPRVRTLVLPRTEPALVTAYRLYGEAARAAELVRRNGVRHPGFVAGGVGLEVLSE